MTFRLKVAGAVGIASALVTAGCAKPAAAPPVLNITAVDYALQMPDTVQAGWTTIHFVNNGKELHQAQLVRLDSGKTAKDFMAAGGDMSPPWEVWVGGPNATVPHDSTTTKVMLQPGHYIALCVIPSPDGTPHIMKGMMKEFVVTGSAATAPAAAASDVVIRTSDYTFDVSPPLTSGMHTFRFENTGPQVHEVVFVKLADGKKGTDFVGWVGAGQQGPPPITWISGTSSLSVGQVAEATYNLTPGTYAMVCFLPDKADHQPHFVHGMVKDFTVN